MAEQVEDEVIVMEGDESDEMPDLNAWLEVNKLNKLKSYFEKEEVDMNDLLRLNAQDIQLRYVHCGSICCFSSESVHHPIFPGLRSIDSQRCPCLLYIFQHCLGARAAERSRIRLVSFLLSSSIPIDVVRRYIHLSMLIIGHMYRTRFMRAFRKLKGEIVDEPLPTFTSNSKSPEKVVYIVISEKV